MKPRIVFYVVAVLVLLAALAAAQTPDRASATGSRQHDAVSPARETSSNSTTGRRPGEISVPDRDSRSPSIIEDGVVRILTPKQRPHTDLHDGNERSNATRAMESPDPGKMTQVQPNPMYKDTDMQGTNPLNESKEKAATEATGNPSKPGTVK